MLRPVLGALAGIFIPFSTRNFVILVPSGAFAPGLLDYDCSSGGLCRRFFGLVCITAPAKPEARPSELLAFVAFVIVEIFG